MGDRLHINSKYTCHGLLTSHILIVLINGLYSSILQFLWKEKIRGKGASFLGTPLNFPTINDHVLT